MKHIILIICLLTSQVYAADISDALTTLSSNDNNAQQAARNELLATFAKASAPGSAGQALDDILEAVYPQLSDGQNPLASRLYLIRMIELFGTIKSTKEIYPLLGDSEAEIRDSARRALAAHSEEQANAYLMDGIKRGALEQRASYIQALAYSQHKAAAEEIVKSLESDNVELQGTAAWALGLLGVAETRTALFAARSKVAPQNVKIVESALLQVGLNPQAAELLVQSGVTASIRVGAFKSLMELDSAMAETLLRSVLADTEFPARVGLISAAMRGSAKNLQKLLIDNLDSLSLVDQILVVAAISDSRASQYEPVLIDLLSTQDADLKIAVVDALGWVGGDASFSALYNLVLKNSDDEFIADAVARLNAPVADERLLAAAKNLADPASALASLQIIGLRNSPGGTDLINSIARDSEDAELSKAAFKAMEKIGNLKSAEILVNIIMEAGSLNRAAQQSLKRLSLSFGVAKLQWETVYGPALKNAMSAGQKQGLILILDAVACEQSLAYLSDSLSDPELRPSVLRTLQRWPRYDVAQVWLKVAMDSSVTEKDLTTAVKALGRAFSSKSMEGSFQDKTKEAVKAVNQASNAELKVAILTGYKEDIPGWQKNTVSNAFKHLIGDPAVGDLVSEMIK